ncbi:MAG: acetyl-CoA acetyltransferase [Gammaproteobacteria bacterium]|jgi:acetyl-CoA acetyltransferase
MSQTNEVDASSNKYLRGKYAICGVGETSYRRGSQETTRSLATWAIGNAMQDAGLNAADIDGMLDYSGNDSTFANFVAGDLGIRLNFYMDVHGGGSSIEALIGIAMGVIEAGMCKTVAIFRSMNGYSQVRIGGTGARSAVPIVGDQIHHRAYGWQSAGQMFAPTFLRHMYDYGTTSEQVAHVKVAHSKHASNNPKAYYKKRYTVEDVVSSRIICKPLHLLDCCVETDNATCVIVTSVERARDCRNRAAVIQSVAGRVCKPRADMHYQHGPISTVAGHYAKEILWPNAGVGPEDIDVTGSYDAFTFTTMLQLEDYGFCKKGEGGDYVSSGAIELGGRRPNNTSGGHLCEGYTHGMNMVIENTRQLRGEVDDSCPIGAGGRRQHTFDYCEGGCRQVKNAELSANLGWASPGTGSAMVMARDHI